MIRRRRSRRRKRRKKKRHQPLFSGKRVRVGVGDEQRKGRRFVAYAFNLSKVELCIRSSDAPASGKIPIRRLVSSDECCPG
jgi:hypothetical protein